MSSARLAGKGRKFLKVIGRRLIDVVVEPVVIEEVRVRAPAVDRTLRRMSDG